MPPVTFLARNAAVAEVVTEAEVADEEVDENADFIATVGDDVDLGEEPCGEFENVAEPADEPAAFGDLCCDASIPK